MSLKKIAVLITVDGLFYDLSLPELGVEKAPVLLRYGQELFVRREDVTLTIATGMVIYVQVTPVDIPKDGYLLEASSDPWGRAAEIVKERRRNGDATIAILDRL
jgi:hypothetical protein